MGKRSNRMSAAKRERRRNAYARYLRERLRPDLQPADPVVLRLFTTLQLGARVNNRSRVAKQLERQAWDYLMRYLLTLERPDIPIL
jgi:hypothetical protein